MERCQSNCRFNKLLLYSLLTSQHTFQRENPKSVLLWLTNPGLSQTKAWPTSINKSKVCEHNLAVSFDSLILWANKQVPVFYTPFTGLQTSHIWFPLTLFMGRRRIPAAFRMQMPACVSQLPNFCFIFRWWQTSVGQRFNSFDVYSCQD